MTEQQKAAIEEAAKNDTGGWYEQQAFIRGAQHVIEHPERYGLVPAAHTAALQERVKELEAIDPAKVVLAEAYYKMQSQLAKYREALAISNPWPITDILSKLIEASETLLHECGYDGHKPGQMPYEDINICVDEAKKAITRIKQALKQEVNND